MSSNQVFNPPAPTEPKSSKKKKAKAEATPQPAVPSTENEAAHGSNPAEGNANGADGTYESPYIKELYKYVWYCSHRPLYLAEIVT